MSSRRKGTPMAVDVRRLCVGCCVLAVVLAPGRHSGLAQENSPAKTAPRGVIRADFRNVRGLNYIASYAPSDVAMWRFYDHDQIDRELGYIKGLGANSVRVWLAWVVFDVEGDRFVEKLADFLSLCEKHRLTVMPILWDSCFGDAKASYDDVKDWVADLVLHWDAAELTPENYAPREALLRWTLISLAWAGALEGHLNEADHIDP